MSGSANDTERAAQAGPAGRIGTMGKQAGVFGAGALVGAGVMAALTLAPGKPQPPGPAGQARVTSCQVWFSPGGGCTDAITGTIGAARTEVAVQACYFDSAPIADALVAAHGRRVKVHVLVDGRCAAEPVNRAGYLHGKGVPVYVDHEHAIAHDKVLIIDGQVVVTGSCNFTNAAERGLEGVVDGRQGMD